MRIAIVYGSTRGGRQGIKAARFAQAAVEARGHEADLIEPLSHPLPLLDKTYKEFDEGQAPEAMERIARLLRAADGFIIVTGEYNHAIPPALTNLLDHFMEEYFWRPSAIISYSAGVTGGVRAAAQLRSLLAEVGMPAIPSEFPIARVQEFGDDGTPSEEMYEERIGRFLDEFEWYMRALRSEREKGVPY